MPNFSIPVPVGATNHGNPNLLCLPPQWTDYFIFYVGNYFAHAATIMLEPGQRSPAKPFMYVFALCFPLLGISRVVTVLLMRPGLVKCSLEKAAKSNALCAVMKIAEVERLNKEDGIDTSTGAIGYPEKGPRATTQQTTQFLASQKWWKGTLTRCDPFAAKHGTYHLPHGYAIYRLPGYIPVRARNHNITEVQVKTEISSSYNVLKVVISTFQLFWTISTLYRARGNQIQQYGYAAFGLTVAPYAWMSFLNLIGNMLAPTYETLYLVWTPSLEEARSQRGVFDGTVGEIDFDSVLDNRDNFQGSLYQRWLAFCLWLFLGLVPFAILGGLSGFAPGQSTLKERAWTMAWIAAGVIVPAVLRLVDLAGTSLKIFTIRDLGRSKIAMLAFLFILLISMTPVIGGLVVVGQMLTDFGVCTLVA